MDHLWYTQWNDVRDYLTSVTLFIAVKFDVSLETLGEVLSVSTLGGDPIITRWVYRNRLITDSHKLT